MSEMQELDKLRVLLPHWIEHNNSHIADFRKWQQVANHAGSPASSGLEEAVAAMARAGEALERVLAELGGPLAPPGHAHHHHHHD